MLETVTAVTPTGTYKMPANDAITEVVQKGGIWDEGVWNWVRERLDHEKGFLDVGAFFGQMAVMAKVRSKWVGVAECNPDLHECLAWNVGPGLFMDHPLWSGSGKTLWMEESTVFPTKGALGVKQTPTSIPLLPSRTLDRYEIVSPVSVMKIDVQGADLHVMLGAKETILRHRMPIVFEYEPDLSLALGHSWEDYAKFIQEIGYRITGELRSSGLNYTIEPTEDR